MTELFSPKTMGLGSRKTMVDAVGEAQECFQDSEISRFARQIDKHLPRSGLSVNAHRGLPPVHTLSLFSR